MSSCSSGETLATPRRGKCLRQRETDEGTSCCQLIRRGYRTMEDFTHFLRGGGLGA